MGKITVKHYINKQLGPIIDEDSKEKTYPLYVSITVMSKNIRRRSRNEILLTENEFIEPNDNLRNHLRYEKNILTRIVNLYLEDYHSNKVNDLLKYVFGNKGYSSKDPFLNNLNSYVDYYSFSVLVAIKSHIRQETEKVIYNKISNCLSINDQVEIRRVFSFIDYPLLKWDFIHNNLTNNVLELEVMFELLQSFTSLYSKSNGNAFDLPLIDWLENKIQPDFIHFIREYSSQRLSRWGIDKYMNEIPDTLINSFIKVIEDLVHSDDYYYLLRNI